MGREMSRCQDWSADILSTVRCQDVKMSTVIAGHLIAHDMSRGFWAVIVRCQDVKMSGQGCAGREMSGGFCDMVVRCQDVKMSKMGSEAREMSRGFYVVVVRCQDV